MTTIVVAGALANKPSNGGEAWVRLSWVRGLQRLGYRVVFLEQISPLVCVDEAGAPSSVERSANLRFFRAVAAAFGLAGHAALIEEGQELPHGLSAAEVRDVIADAAALVNISGHLPLAPPVRRIAHKIFVDIDPGFTQAWHAGGDPGARLAGHDHHYTIGENIGRPDCPIPTEGIAWRPVRQPVVLDDWPVQHGPFDRFTTVGSWRGPYGPVEIAGETYGLKVHEFRKVLPLPEQAGLPFELALAIDPADERDRRALVEQGWRLVDPHQVAGDPHAFRRYVQGSGAEFSVAQGVYVGTNSGWFSDRSMRYLASGRPVLVQDTGFGRTLPTGTGLVPFRTVDDAAAGARAIAADYASHAGAARAIAEAYFAADRVLGKLMDEIGVAP